ncbi:hypothetical protein HDV01_007443 [Terramyces sp. JEL0728]|nr:hypothetical protein HDV01_007443 [Terramyces sp. JEL0728]
MLKSRIWRNFSNITKFTPKQTTTFKYFENRKRKLELKPLLYVGGGFIFFGGIYYATHLEQVPITNRTRFMAVSESQEVALGGDAYHQLKRQYQHSILPSNHPVTKLATKVSKSLIQVSGLTHLDWEVYVIDQNVKNAFVLPGGKIFVFTGILPILKDENGLAAVLGHEIGHVVARHAGEKISWSVALGIFGFLVSVFFDAGAHTRLFTEYGIMVITADIDAIFTQNDIESLQSIIENVTFCNVQDSGNYQVTQDLEAVDPNILKLFQLAQLIIEFLLHTQTDLIQRNGAIDESNSALKQELDQTHCKLEAQAANTEAGKKEIKTLKKAVYAYELMTKIPGAQPNAAPDRCKFCPKAFSSRAYLQAHEERRHSDLLSEEIALIPKPKQDATKKELEKMTELLEKLTAARNEPPKQPAPSEDLVKQEKLKLELELQDIKEKQGKQLVHVGNIESEDEDENKSAMSQLTNEIKKMAVVSKDVEKELKEIKKNEYELKHKELEKQREAKEKEREESVKREIEKLRSELTAKGAQQSESQAQQEKEQIALKLQLHMKEELENIKANLQLESDKKTSVLESKLRAAANQIEELKKSKADLKAQDKPVPVEPEPVESIPPFETQAKRKAESKLEWKDYLSIMKSHTCKLNSDIDIPNPSAPWATSYFDHTVHSMMAQKDIIAHEVEQVLALRGLTQASMKNYPKDPPTKILFEQMKNEVSERHDELLQYNCFAEMYNYMKTNLEKACTEAVGNPLALPISNASSPLKASMNNIAQSRSPMSSIANITQGQFYSPSNSYLTPTYNRNLAAPTYNGQSASSPNLNSSPRRSSLRPSSAPSGGRSSPTKNVKIVENERVKPSSTTIVTENVNQPWYAQQFSASPSNEAASPWSWDNYDRRSVHSQQNHNFHLANASKSSKSNLPTPTAMDLALAIAPKQTIDPALLKTEAPNRPPPSPPKEKSLSRSLSIKSAKDGVTAAKEGFKDIFGKMTRSLSKKGKKPSGTEKFNMAMEVEIKKASNENLTLIPDGSAAKSVELVGKRTLSSSKENAGQDIQIQVQKEIDRRKSAQIEPPKSAKGTLKIQIPHTNSVVTTPSESSISETSEYTSESEQLSKASKNTDISRSRTLSSVPETSEDESSESKLVKIKSLSSGSLNNRKLATQPIPQISIHTTATPVEGAFIVPLVDNSQSHGESSKNSPVKRTSEDVKQSPKKGEKDTTSEFSSFSISELSAPAPLVPSRLNQANCRTEEEEDEELMEFLEEIDIASDNAPKKPNNYGIPDIDDIEDFDD